MSIDRFEKFKNEAGIYILPEGFKAKVTILANGKKVFANFPLSTYKAVVPIRNEQTGDLDSVRLLFMYDLETRNWETETTSSFSEEQKREARINTYQDFLIVEKISEVMPEDIEELRITFQE